MLVRTSETGALLMFGSALAIALGIMVGLLAQPARADDNCAVDLYTHNGSQMIVRSCDSGVWITYDVPRSGIRKQGVGHGQLLVNAEWTSHTGIEGTARVFKRGCGAATYPVSGSMDGDKIVLYGQAPVRGSGCRVTRYRDDHLVFEVAP